MKLDRNQDGKIDANDFFTGEKNKQLLVHIMQDNIEVSKPVKTQIWKQQIEWNQRIFPISHKDFIIDAKGQHHIYVDANTLTTKRFGEYSEKYHKIDAKNARDLLKRKTIEAIWGIDSTHIILLIILGIGMLIAVGGMVFMINQNNVLQGKINSAIATGDTTLLLDKKPAPASTVVTR
jgi:hypothetical protein